jgi:hypothetical protein
MRGTARDDSASDQSSPFVRKSTNWTPQAPAATRVANSIRPARESGVVLGSEIMKKAKSTRAPLSSRCRAMPSGSPSQSDRAPSRAA